MTADPFRWWNEAGRQAPFVDDVLYRPAGWVATFLAYLDFELATSRLPSVRLETARPALVVTGAAGSQALRLARAMYRDVLLFHPMLHPDVEAKVDAAVIAAASECSRLNFFEAENLRRGGRAFLLARPSTLLHPEVVDGLRQLRLSALPAFGVSAVVEVTTDDKSYVIAAKRSARVAVNPGCLGPSVDGGLVWTTAGVDPQAGLRNEIRSELPWLQDDDLTLMGTVLPPAGPTLIAGRPTRRSGVNVVYRASVERDLDAIFASAPNHFEADELALVEISKRGARRTMPAVWEFRDRELAVATDVPPMSEILAATLARRGVVRVSVEKAGRARLSHSERRIVEVPVMEVRSSTHELTLEDAWAEELIGRHSRLDRLLQPERLANFGETDAVPSLDTLAPVFDAVREFEFVRSSGRINAPDEARLFEALVYRVGRYLFANDETRALAAHSLMAPRRSGMPVTGEGRNPIRSAYMRRLEEVVAMDESEDPEGVWREDVAAALRAINRNEAAQDYSDVARLGRLLCFCSALWALEAKRSPDAVGVALGRAYRESLSGDGIALFFRARALLASPVISPVHAQLGLQFVTTALATYDHNPGIHHTKAIFLLRQSALTEVESVSVACLEQALQSVDTALRWDAEFPKFYATRAQVKHRLHDRHGALLDLRAAIELARHSGASPLAWKDVTEWETLLDTWQFSPVGDPTSSRIV